MKTNNHLVKLWGLAIKSQQRSASRISKQGFDSVFWGSKKSTLHVFIVMSNLTRAKKATVFIWRIIRTNTHSREVKNTYLITQISVKFQDIHRLTSAFYCVSLLLWQISVVNPQFVKLVLLSCKVEMMMLKKCTHYHKMPEVCFCPIFIESIWNKCWKAVPVSAVSSSSQFSLPGSLLVIRQVKPFKAKGASHRHPLLPSTTPFIDY